MVNNKVYNVIENNARLSHVNMLNHRIKSTFHGIYFCRFPNADFSDKVGIIRDRKILRYPRSLPEKSDFMFLLYICNNYSGISLKISKAYLTAGNRSKSGRILYLNPASICGYKLRTKSNPPRKNGDLLKISGTVVCFQNKYEIKSIYSKDSTKARYVNFRQNVDWPGEIYNTREV